MNIEDIDALYEQFNADAEEYLQSLADQGQRYPPDYEPTMKHALAKAIERERASYLPVTNLNEDGLGPAIMMRPSEAGPLLRQFKHDVESILSQIKNPEIKASQYSKDMAVEIAVTEAVLREREKRAAWLDLRKLRPEHEQVVDLVWRREGEREIFRCRAQYRQLAHYPGLCGYIGPHFYLLEHAHRYPETMPILILDRAEFILWQLLPAEPTSEQIAAAMEKRGQQ